jgi:hypothetical protein
LILEFVIAGRVSTPGFQGKEQEMGSDFKEYRKKGTQLMRPYIPGETLSGVSVSTEDTPEAGGMIAINRDNPKDQWYVAKGFFEKNYEPA